MGWLIIIEPDNGIVGGGGAVERLAYIIDAKIL